MTIGMRRRPSLLIDPARCSFASLERRLARYTGKKKDTPNNNIESVWVFVKMELNIKLN